MNTSKRTASYGLRLVAILTVLLGTATTFAQEVSMALLQPAALPPAPAPMIKNNRIEPLPAVPSEHGFWDNKNRILFGVVAGMSAADFAVTHANLQSGGKELNPVTRVFSGSTAGLATNFAIETAGVIGLSYFFHKTGHHKMERATSLLNIGGSSFAVAYGLAHR